MAQFIDGNTEIASSDSAGEFKNQNNTITPAAGESKNQNNAIIPIPNEPTFDALRKKIKSVQEELDKTFGPGKITGTVDVSQLIASEAWSNMDSKSSSGKPGQQMALR